MRKESVWVHHIPGSSPWFHNHGKLTPTWHDFPVSEFARDAAIAGGFLPCPNCYPKESS